MFGQDGKRVSSAPRGTGARGLADKGQRRVVYRYLNAGCYLVSGVFLLVIASGSALAVIVSVIAIAYGLYVGLTRHRYWVSTYTYLVPLVLVAVGASRL